MLQDSLDDLKTNQLISTGQDSPDSVSHEIQSLSTCIPPLADGNTHRLTLTFILFSYLGLAVDVVGML